MVENRKITHPKKQPNTGVPMTASFGTQKLAVSCVYAGNVAACISFSFHLFRISLSRVVLCQTYSLI